MPKKPRLCLEVLVAGLLILSAALTLAIATERPVLLLPVGILLLLIIAGLWAGGAALRGRIARWLSGGVFEGSEVQYTLAKLPVPVMLLSGKTLLWYNPPLRAALLGGQDSLLLPVSRVLPGLDLRACAAPAGQCLEQEGRRYTAYASTVAGREELSVVFLVDDTTLKEQAAEYAASRPAYMIFEIDGYDEVFGGLRDSERARVLEGINRTLETAIGRTTGFLRRVANSRYIAVVEERHMREMAAARFDLLDKVRALDENLNLTLSIGVGRGGATLAECQEMARQALDMALGRGGDQAAVKMPDGFEFYGGVSRSVEKRSKVKSRMVANALADMIRQSDSVLVMGHRMSDLDSAGAAVGVLRICKQCDVPAAIVLRREATLASPLLAEFDKAGLGEDFISPETALEGITKNTLLVVVDTYLKGLLESFEVYQKCRHVAVIDHHRKAVGHIENTVVLYHEPYASSACELVSELLQYVGDGRKDQGPTPLEAQALLAGIMLDTRNFALHTGVRTFEAAAYLRRMGAETSEVKKLFSSSMEEYTAKSDLVERAEIYKSCAVSVGGELAPGLAVAVPQAANDLLTITGVNASFVAVQKGGGVNISARSMGAVNVQVILEKLGGGGHLTMAGAQLKDTTPAQARQLLMEAIDAFYAEQDAKKKPAE